MQDSDIFINDYYVITKDFRLVQFNDSVRATYEGIRLGDYCYAATMKRDTPCLHCPIAGNSDCDCPVYYDPFYEEWIEAIFSKIDDYQFAVCCRQAKNRGMRVFDALGKEDNEELIRKVSGHAVNEHLLEMENKLKELNDIRLRQYDDIVKLNFELENKIERITDLNKELMDKQRRIEEQLEIEKEHHRVIDYLKMKEEISRELSMTDTLTGLGNRRASDEFMDDYRMETNIGIVFSDLNGLKEINDSRGHGSGDERLKHFAGILCECFGQENSYRISGDEFIVYVKERSQQEFEQMLSQFRRRIIDEGRIAAVGACYGAEDIRKMISSAENEMYDEKRIYYEISGHNRRRR